MPDPHRYNRIDRQLGLVFGALEMAGLTASTVAFFASDNGASNEGNHGYDFFSSSGPLNGFKRSLHGGLDFVTAVPEIAARSQWTAYNAGLCLRLH